MKLYRGLFVKILSCLDLTFNKGEYADKVVQELFKTDKQLGSTDRKIVAEAVYEIVRWKRLYAYIADISDKYETEDLKKLVKVWLVLNKVTIPDWDDIRHPDPEIIESRWSQAQAIRTIRESIPDWMDELCSTELGEDVWESEIRAQNIPAKVILRANTLFNTAPQLRHTLANEKIETVQITYYPDALVLTERRNVFVTHAYKTGLFEVQDASSQLIAPFMDVQPGMMVVDACAGAGGKSLHIAALMQNKGRLVAMDVHEHKLEKLKVRARRNKVHNIECRVIESSKSWKRLKEAADRVLIDAPCSGLGVLRRNPDDKWKLNSEKINDLRKTQQELLSEYSTMVKPGGKLIYATCSILPSENQVQVNTFLNSEAGKNFKFEDEKIILASESGYDGFYMVKLLRIES